MLDIVIVNWNSEEYLNACLASISDSDSQALNKVVVVDNGSEKSPVISDTIGINVELILVAENLGFAKACNMGAKRCSSKYILFLNPDTVLSVETLNKTLLSAEDSSNAKIGIIGVQLLDGTGGLARSCSRFPSVSGLVAKSTGLDVVFPRLGVKMLDWDHRTSREVDQVIGAFFLVRRKLFFDLGGFDERFFVYFEEVDFSRRAYLVGWRSFYLTEAHAYHAGGGASDQVRALRLFYTLRSRLQYVHKHFSFAGAVTVAFFTLFIEPASRVSLTFFRRSLSGLAETVEAYGMLWLWVLKKVIMRLKVRRKLS